MEELVIPPPEPNLVKQGWLMKRGEHIKTWRGRYFMLFENGSLFGYKQKPEDQVSLREPLNNFTVRGCQVLKTERPRANTFILRGLFYFPAFRQLWVFPSFFHSFSLLSFSTRTSMDVRH